MHRAVIFVDSKSRDLMGVALIAHHLEKRGIDCRLGPLGAWRACIGAWKPDFVLFNHLNAAHLAPFSRQCRDWGILVGVLPNEGVFYVEGTLGYNARKQYSDTHCDRVFCWNEVHRAALIENGFCTSPDHVVPVGVPRFDFYLQPWRKLFTKRIADTRRPVILVNANFPHAHFQELPPKVADNFFGQWKHINSIYADYRGAIQANYSGRLEFLKHLDALMEADKYYLIVRPHPRENLNFYLDWYATLSPERQKHVRLGMKEDIFELIANADLELSCENCTTTMEAWICGKPTVGLTFRKHPFFYTPEVGRLLPECDKPQDVVKMVDQALANPAQAEYGEARRRHMEKWLFKVDGHAAERVAIEIEKSISQRTNPTRIRLGFSDRRRGVKLRIARFLGEPCHVSPVLVLRRLLKGTRGKQTVRYRDYLKAIRPADERRARELIRSVESAD